MEETQKERAARNQSLFREVNERIENLVLGGPIEFLCECCDPACSDTIVMLRREYETVREQPGCFAVKPGHEVSDVEGVVGRGPTFLVVEKLHEGRQLAEVLGPRH